MQRTQNARGEVAVVGAVALIALGSVVSTAPKMLRSLAHAYRGYAKYTAADRRHAATNQLEIPGDVLDFYADRITKGDRVYFQVDPSGLSSNMTLAQAVAFAGRFYLLPAVQTTDLADANTVVSFQADPGTLGLKYAWQQRAGVQLFFVSKIAGR